MEQPAEPLLLYGPYSVFAVFDHPQPCPKCKTMHLWFVNFDGKTLCVSCQTKRLGIVPL